MICAECRDLFSAFADDALASDARGTVEQHLAGCAECRHEWQRFSSTVELLHAVQRERAPAGFVDRVLAAARPLPWYRRLARGLLVPWTVKLPLEAAAIVMVAGVGVLVFRQLPETEMAHFGAPMESRSAAPADAVDRFTGPQELLARSNEGDAPVAAPPASTPPRQTTTAPEAPAPAAQPPASRRADSTMQAVDDARTQNQLPRGQDTQAPRGYDAQAPRVHEARVPGAKPDAERSETAPPAIAQPPSQAPVTARRQPLPDQAAAPPPAAKSLPAAPNVAAAGASVDETRAKRQDKLAKEAERDAPGARTSAAREGKVEGMIARSVASNVELRLATTDRAATAREIAAVVERLGGAMVTPAPDTLEIMVANSVFAALTGDLSRLGTLRIVQQPGELPDVIRITLRLID